MFLYNKAWKRTLMRLLEIFLISGVIGVLSSKTFIALIPAVCIGIVAAVLKALREYESHKSFIAEHRST